MRTGQHNYTQAPTTSITVGGDRKSFLLAVKSSTLIVADIIINFRGLPFCKRQ